MDASMGLSTTEIAGDLDNTYLIGEWRQWSDWGVLKVIGGENVETLCLDYSFKKSGYKGEQQKELSKKRELTDV